MKQNKIKLVSVAIAVIIGILVVPIAASAFNIAEPVHDTNAKDMTPFYWMVAIVGGLIAVTLTYVSWKKYKGDEKKRTNNDPNS
ncbi:sporulation protein YpjB [Virgibacillus oceani]|uniref:Sporulation protein n=1 Tax=Virgibacillus oceani TaxID=1479511 RepID=A0A917LYG4_9BACI|nr:sporulation protein YpjB [Virgibacillus oceani]GGG65391.1 hypothetical protein GCM10011398_06310 [Virgibacillus oceani]